MPDIRRVLKVIFVPEASAEPDAATISIRRNGFMFTELGANQFLIMTPSQHYGGEIEMEEDLNQNAIGGKYRVGRASPAELEAFERTDGHLHN